jgi:hypothetical protein
MHLEPCLAFRNDPPERGVMLRIDLELREIAGILDQATIPYALIGELAVSLYTHPRPTTDIDLLLAPEDWEQCLAALDDAGLVSVVQPRLFPRAEIRRMTKKIPRSTDSLAVDFLMANTDELRKVLESRQSVQWEGVRLWFADREGLIYTRKLRGTNQDLEDVKALSPAKND